MFTPYRAGRGDDAASPSHFELQSQAGIRLVGAYNGFNMTPVDPIGIVTLPDGKARYVHGDDVGQFVCEGQDRYFGGWIVPSEEPLVVGEGTSRRPKTDMSQFRNRFLFPTPGLTP